MGLGLYDKVQSQQSGHLSPLQSYVPCTNTPVTRNEIRSGRLGHSRSGFLIKKRSRFVLGSVGHPEIILIGGLSNG